MIFIRSVKAMQRLARGWRRVGARVGFVPTMGYLHAGHVSLVRRARRLAGPKGKVVASIFVNPTQFGPTEDFARYPRDLKMDRKLCAQAGADVVFAPDAKEIYPKDFSTYVVEQELSRPMEGQSRPTHFRGVATVVAKLFNIVLPDVAVFGAKDFQQAAVVKRMVRDLNFPVKIVIAPTVRERDGLALSSRNKYLEEPLRRQAIVLSQAIAKARAAVRRTNTVQAGALRSELRGLIEQQPAARVDYIEFFNPDTLQPVKSVDRRTHMALAVFIGSTRLIDNAALNGKGD
ncbi:MAG TPA: pantoate--beta-alanine ligase [Candidatus Binatia bacterium]|nr:pantoate--beta-alanine ligase [Candidatus Binatia bacterium]